MTPATATAPPKRKKDLQSIRRRRIAERRVSIDPLADDQRGERQRLEADSHAWIWRMCGPGSGILEPLTYEFTEQQSVMIAAYDHALRYGGDSLTLASRGEGKTSYARATIWKSTSDGTVNFAALVAATGDDANHSRTAIAEMVATSLPFAELYPEIAIPVVAIGATAQTAKSLKASGRRIDNGRRYDLKTVAFTWSAEGLDFPNIPGSPSARAMIRFRGADKAIRGLNIAGRRPQVVAMDDLDSPNTVTGRIENAQKVIDRVDTDIGGLRGQRGSFARMMLATLPKQASGVAHHYATQGQPFVVHRHKYLIEKPERWDLWMKYVQLRQRAKAGGDTHGREAHHFFLKNREEMRRGAKVSNPHRYNDTVLPDGTQTQLDALQNYFDEWADKGEFFCRCELDNELIERETQIVAAFQAGHVAESERDRERGVVDVGTDIVTRGIDVRKIELHYATLAFGPTAFNQIPDYGVKSHGTSETTREMAEQAILDGLHRLADHLDSHPLVDTDGNMVQASLTLIDKGWKASWTEDGETKTWIDQPVEQFCEERTGGLRRWLAAKGQPAYQPPKADRNVIVGDRWHINQVRGKLRSKTEVIWDAEHYHALVEDLFTCSDPVQRFKLFAAPATGIHAGHQRLTLHIQEGSEDLADLRRRQSKTKKPRYRRDHWWDAIAMALVAKSVEMKIRELETRRRSQRKSLAELSRAANG